MIEAQVASSRKSMGVAYALWLFLGLLSLHRFYLERPGTAILQIILNCLIIGLLWTLFDAFLIPGMIRQQQDRMRARLYGVAMPETVLPNTDTSKWSRRDRENYDHQRRLAGL